MFPDIDRTLVILSCIAAALVCAMLSLYLVTGIGQDPLQFVHAPGVYGEILLRAPSTLRAVIGLDDAFLTTYGCVFVLLAISLCARGARVPLVATATAFMLATTLLDLLENMNFLANLAAAELGSLPSAADIHWQVLLSTVKFHVSYLGLLLFGFALPRSTGTERTLAWMLCWLQAPVGIAIYVVPAGVATPLVFLRFAFFLASFVLLARIHSHARARTAGGSAEPA